MKRERHGFSQIKAPWMAKRIWVWCAVSRKIVT